MVNDKLSDGMIKELMEHDFLDSGTNKLVSKEISDFTKIDWNQKVYLNTAESNNSM